MSSRSTRILALVVVAVAAAFGVAVAVLLLGDSGTASRADYQAAVVNARDRVDFALARLSKAQSLEELLDRMDEAAVVIDGAADKVDASNPPPEFEAEHAKLIGGLRSLAVDVKATADQARVPGYADLLFGARGLSFDGWDEANAAITSLREKGLAVKLLSRHTTS